MTEVDLAEFTERIVRPDDAVRVAARAALSRLTLPPEGLGRLGDLAVWLAGTRGTASPPPLERVRVIVVAAEHGIAEAGVSAWRPGATGWLVDRVSSGAAVVSAQAALAGVSVRLLDVGVGTPSGRIDREDAFPVAAAHEALAAGIAAADEEIDAGADLLVLGDVGVGSTTIAATVIGLLTGSDAAAVTGRGSGIDDGAWMRKCAAIRDGMRRGRPLLADHPAMLARAGGADVAALAGLLLECAARRTPVVFDGVVGAAAALLAQRVAFRAVDWWLPAHRTADPAHRLALERLAFDPVLDLGLDVGEGVAALALLPMLQVASALLAHVQPWEREPVPGEPFDDAT